MKAESSRNALMEFYDNFIVVVNNELLMTDSSVIRKRAGSKKNSKHFVIF